MGAMSYKLRSEISRIRGHLESMGRGHECLGVNKWTPKERAAYLLAIAGPLDQVTEDYENIIVLDLRRKAS